MGVDGNRKGQEYMRCLSRLLSEWVCGSSVKGILMAELPIRVKTTVVTPVDGWGGAGDFAVAPEVQPFPFAMEAKDVEGWSFDGALQNKRWMVWNFWEQTLRQAEKVDLIPMLLFTKNRYPDWIMLPEGVDDFVENTLYIRSHGVEVMLLDDFLATPYRMQQEHWSA